LPGGLRDRRRDRGLRRPLGAPADRHRAKGHFPQRGRPPALCPAACEIGDAIEDYAGLWARPLIATAQKDTFRSAADQMRTNGGRSRLAGIRGDFAGLFRRQLAVIRSRENRAQASSSRAIGFGVEGPILVLVVAIGSAAYLRRRSRAHT
jgi:hypothetical protein